MPTLNYTELNKIEFTDADVAEVIALLASGDNTKPLAVLNTDNFPNGEVPVDVMTQFTALAKVLRVPLVPTNYNGIQLRRPYTDDELRESALSELRHGYKTRPNEIRAERAAEQGINIYNAEEK